MNYILKKKHGKNKMNILLFISLFIPKIILTFLLKIKELKKKK